MSVRTFRHWFLPVAKRASLILHATDREFDVTPSSSPEHHRYVGPLLWEPAIASPAFLDTPGPPWVLVSLSTLPQDGEVAIARTGIRALRHEAVRVLVTLAPDHAVELGEVPDHVYISDYVPHSTVLADSRLVISHAGHGIVMKALYRGVPMGADTMGSGSTWSRGACRSPWCRDRCAARRNQ